MSKYILKKCTKCGQEKCIIEFYKKNRKYHSRCKECHKLDVKKCPSSKRDSKLRYHYGITLEQYDNMVSEQCGRCLVCGNIPDRLQVDHCHSSGKIRGLLCFNCNAALGLIKENKHIAFALTKYIESNCQNV